jgi:hypothetical protein
LIYAVSTHSHVSSDEHLDKPDKILRSLAAETGGQAFFPATSLEFARSFESISTELRSQFSLAYSSTNSRRDGVFRKIRIESWHGKRHYAGSSGWLQLRSVVLESP